MSGEAGPRPRGKILAVAVLVSVFMAGGLTAAAVIQVMRAADPPEAAGVFEGRRPGMGPGMGPGAGRMAPGGGRGAPGLAPMAMSRRMAQHLELSEEQREQIREILERRHEAADSIMRHVAPRLRAQLDSTQAEIREVLDPEQRQEFDRWRERGRQDLFRRFQGGG